MIDAVRLRVVLVALAGWVNRHQLEVIEYLREENRVLKELLDGRRLRLTDVQRRRLAVNGHRKGWRLIEPKSEGSRRTIRLPPPVVPILRAHRVRQRERRLAAGARWREHEFVFTTRGGQPLDGCRLNRQTKAQLKAAGLPPLKFHSLRHSCATFLLVQGVAPRVVMDTFCPRTRSTYCNGQNRRVI